jgi:Flp pilus assembly pilin Flp
MNPMVFTPTLPRFLGDNRAVVKLRLPRLPRFLKDRKGIETGEVGVLLAAVVAVVYAAFQLLGININEVVNRVAGMIQ